MTTNLIQTIIDRWTAPDAPPLIEEALVKADGPINPDTPGSQCRFCAQGDILHHEGGHSPWSLYNMRQITADDIVANLLGISLARSRLIRIVNDTNFSLHPVTVLTNPTKVLGPNAETVLRFWRDYRPNDLTLTGALPWRDLDIADEEACKVIGPMNDALVLIGPLEFVSATRELIAFEDLRARTDYDFPFLRMYGYPL